jgi:FecR protein
MSERSADLIAGYLDGGLSAIERSELAELVDRDHHARQQLIDAARMHRQLIAELRPVDLSGKVLEALRLEGERYVERVMSEVRAQLRPRPGARSARSVRASWLLPLALAAGIAGAVLAWQGMLPRMVDQAAPSDAHSIGALRLIEGGASRVLPPGSAISGGAQVTLAGPAGGVAFADGTSVMLSPGAQLRLLASATGGKRLELSEGELTATVAKQPPGRPLLVATPSLLATVVGTSFCLRTSSDSFLAVGSGVVHVRELAHGGEFDVAQGQALLVRNGAAPLWSKATLWSLDGQWQRVVTAGRQLREAGAAGTLIGSVAFRPLTVNPYFTPEQYVCMQSGKLIDHARQLFVLPAGFRLHLRLRAEHAGTAMVTMQPPQQATGVTANHGSKRFAVDASWREIALAAGDFEAAPAPRTLAAGYPIACISLWGFSCGALQLSDFTLESTLP